MDSAVIKAFGGPAAMPMTRMAHRSAYLIKGGKIVYSDYKGTTDKLTRTRREHLDSCHTMGPDGTSLILEGKMKFTAKERRDRNRKTCEGFKS